MIQLRGLLPAAEQGWLTLFELAEESDSDWVLVGGQMIYLLAEEHGAQLPRATDDMDVVVDVRTRPGATGWLAAWLMDRGFEQGDISADGICHRFTRAIGPGFGVLIFDVLAPDAAVMTATYHVPHLTPRNMPHTIGGAWTAVFQKRGNRWVIVQEHLSDLPPTHDSTMMQMPGMSMPSTPAPAKK